MCRLQVSYIQIIKNLIKRSQWDLEDVTEISSICEIT